MSIPFLLFASLVYVSGAQIFRLPEERACEQRIIHAERFGKAYHFSWRLTDQKWDWEGARNYCRRFCMDSVAIEGKPESNWINKIIKQNNLHYIWTGGRKCNFAGCDRPDLQPAIQNGWYWASTGGRIPSPNSCKYCFWSNTGGLEESQPDNREQRQGGNDEACIGILNDFYNDGIKWHDIECRHKKPVICQDSNELLDFVFGPEK